MKKILLIGGGVVGVCIMGVCVLTAISAATVGSRTPTPVAQAQNLAATEKPQATPKPGETPKPTNTPKPTDTPKPPTATATPKPPTATPIPPPNKADAVYLDPRELAADPKSYIGKNIYLQGQTLTVEHNDQMTGAQMMAQVRGKDFVTESTLVVFSTKEPKILRQECYRFYGIVAGTQKMTRALTGASNDVPYLLGYAWESSAAGQYGGCVSP